MAAVQGPPFGAWRVFARSLRIWGKSIVPFTAISLVVHSPLLLLAYGGPSMGAGREYRIIQELGRLLLGWMTTAALAHGVFQRLVGQRASVIACLRVCIERFLPVVAVSLLVFTLIALCCLLPLVVLADALIGFGEPDVLPLLLVALGLIPAALVFSMYWVSVPVTVVERPGILAAVRRSARLTRGERVPILSIVLLVHIVERGTEWGLLRIAGDEDLTRAAVGLVVAIVLGPLGAVANSVTYHDLRAVKEGVGVADLIRVFA